MIEEMGVAIQDELFSLSPLLSSPGFREFLTGRKDRKVLRWFMARHEDESREF